VNAHANMKISDIDFDAFKLAFIEVLENLQFD